MNIKTDADLRAEFEAALLNYGAISQQFQARECAPRHLAQALTMVLQAYEASVGQASHVHDLTSPEWCIRCLKAHDAGAILVARKLEQIAQTGQHWGTFGGKELESAAQSILRAIKAAKNDGLRMAVKITRTAAEFGASTRTIVSILQDKINGVQRPQVGVKQ